jgi:flagellar assembly protein FliH
MSRSRVIRASADGTRWAGPALDLAQRTASPVGGQFRASDSPKPAAEVESEQRHEDGFAKGYEEGLQAAQQQMAQNLAVMTNLTAYLREPISVLNEQVDDELVRLVLAITRQVVRREVRTDPQQIAAVVREARGALNDVRGTLRISLHPEEAALVRAMFTPDESLAGIVVEEDPSITRGGCTLSSDASFVDARMEARIAQIAVGLLGDEREPRAEQADE